MPTVQDRWPLSISGRCQKIRIADASTQTSRRPCRRSRIGAANANHPASSPKPTSTSTITIIAGTVGQSAHCSAVGSGAPSPWLISTLPHWTTAGASTASRYHFGATRQSRRRRPHARNSVRPWQATTISAAGNGPNGKFWGLDQAPYKPNR
ncbi:hypothetical protein GCM10009741_77530 [Kribbella lupini]|uniref:Uncharacterized protein n=1 Tax=Kribbella lupini TaxID=291602 RepID=A0ABN2CQU3_9ACTN